MPFLHFEVLNMNYLHYHANPGLLAHLLTEKQLSGWERNLEDIVSNADKTNGLKCCIS